MTRLLLVAALSLLALALGAGCTLLWAFNQDPQGLPCDFEVDDEGACLDGYTCIVQDNKAICVHAGVLQEGDVCARTEECESDLACHSAYEKCAEDDDDINCDLISDEEIKKRCHTKCDPEDPDLCRKEERCFTVNGVKGVKGVCQTGTCASDTDCETADDEGAFCATFTVGEKTGVCLEACDMLACRGATGICGGCDGRDDDNDGFNCVPLSDGLHPQPSPVCFDAGPVPYFGDCLGFMDECELGSFCVDHDINPNTPSYCSPYCFLGGGFPECPNGGPEKCAQLLGNTGFCLP